MPHNHEQKKAVLAAKKPGNAVAEQAGRLFSSQAAQEILK